MRCPVSQTLTISSDFLHYLCTMRRTLFLLFFILSAFFSRCQRVINFNLYQVPNSAQVTVKFTIKAGVQCSGYTIWYSSDSITYSPVYNYPGTCGGSGTNEDFSWTHPNPVQNATNYYRIELIPSDFSDIKRIYVTAGSGSNSMIVYPNPMISDDPELKMKLLNVIDNTRFIGWLVNQSGKPVQDLDLFTKNDMVSIYTTNLPNDLYIIYLLDYAQTKLFRGKVFIHR
jgi:hypothetical protein